MEICNWINSPFAVLVPKVGIGGVEGTDVTSREIKRGDKNFKGILQNYMM
jgi:hypothetical protein